ncbi:hypothetical protein GNI_031970 [Gregarina niphandrodes]|uniref:Uncharacterized protein n=1 Tax=Gregarina niphandrodes TaxID=110365 RepID=A0A023BAW9_GRENI|nr:hypothetical protein GNI_031970 [Gregarina niphandrodes]EZG78819.1 hypothetical protein GNI_031970 [Gregarina niphandrodes]|eukprot:XP_011129186.1 hypothetical protein GNI_031970 [Gregarina niphandrodes]
MRAFSFFLVGLLASAKRDSRKTEGHSKLAEATPSSALRKSKRQPQAAEKGAAPTERRKLLAEEPRQLHDEEVVSTPLKTLVQAIRGTEADTPMLAQVVGTVADTGRGLIGTAINGNRLLQNDARRVVENAALPLYQSLASDAKVILGTGKTLVGSAAETIGYRTLKQDARNIIVNAADVVRQGEQNLAGTFKNFLPPVIVGTIGEPAS